MIRRRTALAVLGAGLLVLAAWGLMLGLERVMGERTPAEQAAPAPAAPPADTPQRHITATLFYGSADGQHLVALQREVPYGEGTVEQGRQIVLAQMQQPAPESLVPVVPSGGTLRSFYVSERGDAFVDFGPEILASHPGGSIAELFTVYAIVNAVTANLPAVKRVQILVDGREIDTFAGHIDLRRPLQRNDTIVRPAAGSR